MLLKVTELNAWERERWTYLLDAELQKAAIINYLMIFVRLANEQFEKDKTSAHGSLFASSKYFIEFYDEILTGGKYPILINDVSRLQLNSSPTYKDGDKSLKQKISLRKIKSAMITMRDKRENKLYKNFESLFLKSK